MEDASLHKQVSSTLEVLDEMRSVRCIEHTGRAKFITPFVGAQIDICNALDFTIPKECVPKYTPGRKTLRTETGRLNQRQRTLRVNCTFATKTHVY